MQTWLRSATISAVHTAARFNVIRGIIPMFVMAALFVSPLGAYASEASVVMGEAVLLRIDSLVKSDIGLSGLHGKSKSGKVFDFGKLLDKLAPGGASTVLMQRGPSRAFDLAIPNQSSITRKLLESSDGGDSVWAAEQFTSGQRPSLVSRLNLEGQQVVDARVMGAGKDLGWPIFKLTELGQCDTLKNAWIFIPKQGGFSLPDQADGFRLNGKLEICLDQTGSFISRYPGYDSLPYQRYHAVFNPSGKVFRKKDGAGNQVDADVPQEYRQALDLVDREQYWFFEPANGPFLLIEKSNPLEGERWKINFYGAK